MILKQFNLVDIYLCRYKNRKLEIYFSTALFDLMFFHKDLILTNICLLTIQRIWHELPFIILHAILVQNYLFLVRNIKWILIWIWMILYLQICQKVLIYTLQACRVNLGHSFILSVVLHIYLLVHDLGVHEISLFDHFLIALVHELISYDCKF